MNPPRMDYLGAIFQLGTAIFPKRSIVCRIILKAMGVIFLYICVYCSRIALNIQQFWVLRSSTFLVTHR